MAGHSALWQPQELRAFVDWRARERPNAAWATRYGGPFRLIDKLLERSRIQWKLARRATNAAILGLALLVIAAVVQEHELKSNTVGGAVFVAICLGLTYRGILISFSSARTWAGILVSLCILAWASGIYNLISGQFSLIEYEILSSAAGIVEIACVLFVFLQLRRLAPVRSGRRWYRLKWLSRLFPRKRRTGLMPGSPMLPVTSSRAQEQVAADAGDPEWCALEREAEHWWTATRRDTAITGAVVALPIIAGLIWAALAWRGVHQVEAEMKFVPIPAGCFTMGSGDPEAGRRGDEGPVHKVCVNAFELGQYKVTQAEWRRVMVFIHSDPSHFHGDDRFAVESVSWNDAQSFLRVMSLFGHGEYRLPSEAEWEYAARAGTTTSRYWGDSIDDGCAYENIADLSLKKVQPSDVVANCDDGYGNTTAPVGSFKPNPWQLYDALGNTMDWVEDCYVDNYRNTPTDGSANTGTPCPARVIRGVSWGLLPSYVRSADRISKPPNTRANWIGFRVAKTATR
jgi:formylglycine-generating enzyme required for sulfatase activity